MGNKSSYELMEYLGEIAEKSYAGEIPWNQPNPSTFQWTQNTEDDALVVVLQKAHNPKSKNLESLMNGRDFPYTYLFQVQSKASRQTVISISSMERPEFQKVLNAIFEGAERGIDIRSSQVLRKLLGRK